MSAPAGGPSTASGAAPGWFRCGRCGHELAPCAAVFEAAAGGSSGVWCNPHGYLHEVLTVAAAPGVRSEGEPDPHHSWFPDTAWRHGCCRGCGDHVGWHYLATGPAAPMAAFVGLRIACLIGPPE